jgi:uncharacterized membrane protein YgcG
VAFVIGNGLAKFLRDKDWTSFARRYNGPGFKANKYDTKMAAAYKRFAKDSAIPAPKLSSTSSAKNTSDPAKIESPTTINSPIVPVTTPSIAVATVSAEPQDKIDLTINKWSSRFVAIPAALFSLLGGLASWITSSPANITITLVVAGTAVAVVYIVGRQIVTSLREARESKIQREREARSHEVQLALINSAADKDKNTITLVAPPTTELPNSDPILAAGEAAKTVPEQ